MKYVKFIGDPKDNHSGPNTITVHGFTFQANRWKEIDEMTPEGKMAVDKLKGNSHFKVWNGPVAPKTFVPEIADEEEDEDLEDEDGDVIVKTVAKTDLKKGTDKKDPSLPDLKKGTDKKDPSLPADKK